MIIGLTIFLIFIEIRKTCSLAFPRRVFVPWLAGMFICDYLQPSEKLEVCFRNFDQQDAFYMLEELRLLLPAISFVHDLPCLILPKQGT